MWGVVRHPAGWISINAQEEFLFSEPTELLVDSIEEVDDLRHHLMQLGKNDCAGTVITWVKAQYTKGADPWNFQFVNRDAGMRI